MLGQLRSPSAVEPLIKLFKLYDDWDWFDEEIIDVFHLIGPAAIPELSAYFSNDDNEIYNRILVANTLQKIGNTYPESRERCIEILIEELKFYKKNDIELNGFLVSFLLDLKAVQAAELIERVFAEDRIFESICGDWDRVQVELGLKSRESLRKNKETQFPLLDELLTLHKQESAPPQKIRRGLRSSNRKIRKKAVRKRGRKNNSSAFG
ncbi:MAG: PBS lyase [Cyanobacteria bacterium J007]|nr:MAG: PBS lyase [Cyanobacteria bacterium J007]